MQIERRAGRLLVSTPHYRAELAEGGEAPALLIAREGAPLLRLPLAGGLERPGQPEQLSAIHVVAAREQGAALLIEAAATSSLWRARRFRWELSADQIVASHTAEGEGPLGRCFFASNGVGGPWGSPGVPGVAHQIGVLAGSCFAPRINHANRFVFDIAEPHALGIMNEALARAGRPRSDELFLPDQLTGLFAPPLLALALGQGSVWASVGIGARPGDYQFNALSYSGARLGGASLSVDYLGYREAGGLFESPALAIHFGYSPYEALAGHVAWLDASGYATGRRYPSPRWHRAPIFCGWAEQTVIGRDAGVAPADLATQANYERWVAEAEARGIPFGTLVIDDKWQRGYGSFDVDTDKWPDMPGFIARQHERGRRVLLWVPAYHREGLPPELCVRRDGRPLAADVSSPAYEALLRRQVRHLMLEVGADGFKEDWVGGVTAEPGLEQHAPLHGIEFLRRFQHILYDEAHACKPDALIETQTPHPLLRESSDVLRLNDLWFATRDVPEVMRTRARLARLAGWELVDCDNASASALAEWWAYTQAQPSIGIPALYFLTETESTRERPSAAQWAHLAELWRDYRRDQGLD